MAYGTILGQTPTASNVSYNNSSTSSIITGTNVQQAIDQLFTSVSNGKQQIASAITDKGVSTSASDSFATMAENIGKISTGIGLEAFGKFTPYTGGNVATLDIVPGMMVATFNVMDAAGSNVDNYLYLLFCDEKSLCVFNSRYYGGTPSIRQMNSRLQTNISTINIPANYYSRSSSLAVNFNTNKIDISGNIDAVRTCICIYQP